MKRFVRFIFFSASPLQGLFETSALAFVLLYLFHLLSGSVDPLVFRTGILFYCAASGLWAVLRIRPFISFRGSGMRWGYQLVYEVFLATAVSLIMGVGVKNLALWTGWREFWVPTSWGDDFVNTLLFLTGGGYLFCRVMLKLISIWNILRQKHILWSLTHAHLLVVMAVSLVVSLVYFLLSPYAQASLNIMPLKTNLVSFVVTRLLLTIFPTLYLYLFTVLAALLIVLPPSALFSYLFARRITQRLNRLVKATTALRSGLYDVRVPVEGQDELSTLLVDFNNMADKLQSTLTALQQERDKVALLLQQRQELTAVVSHELRTPVSVVRLRLETALDSLSQATSANDLEHDLQVSHEEILRLQALIDDLFLLANADVQKLSVVCTPQDLKESVQQVVDTFRPLAWRTRKVEVVTDCADAPLIACVDANRFKQVLINLVRNAVDHTLPGGVVAITAYFEAGEICIDVRDTGEGISADDLPHIWERFYRGGNNGVHYNGGAGLGLALVKELTEAMQGRVGVKSEMGRGSCFSLYFPESTIT